MMLFFLVLAFISPCFTSPPQTTKPGVTFDEFKKSLEDSFMSWEARSQSTPIISILNKPKRKGNPSLNSCLKVQTPEMNLNFNCDYINITISMKDKNVTVLLNNDELIVNTYLEFDCYLDSKVKVSGNISDKMVEKDSFVRIELKKVTRILNSTWIYTTPNVTKALVFYHKETSPVIINDLDIGKENLDVVQNSIIHFVEDKYITPHVERKRYLNLSNSSYLDELNKLLSSQPYRLEQLSPKILNLNNPLYLFN